MANSYDRYGQQPQISIPKRVSGGAANQLDPFAMPTPQFGKRVGGVKNSNGIINYPGVSPLINGVPLQDAGLGNSPFGTDESVAYANARPGANRPGSLSTNLAGNVPNPYSVGSGEQLPNSSVGIPTQGSGENYANQMPSSVSGENMYTRDSILGDMNRNRQAMQAPTTPVAPKKRVQGTDSRITYGGKPFPQLGPVQSTVAPRTGVQRNGTPYTMVEGNNPAAYSPTTGVYSPFQQTGETPTTPAAPAFNYGASVGMTGDSPSNRQGFITDPNTGEKILMPQSRAMQAAPNYGNIDALTRRYNEVAINRPGFQPLSVVDGQARIPGSNERFNSKSLSGMLQGQIYQNDLASKQQAWDRIRSNRQAQTAGFANQKQMDFVGNMIQGVNGPNQSDMQSNLINALARNPNADPAALAGAIGQVGKPGFASAVGGAGTAAKSNQTREQRMTAPPGLVDPVDIAKWASAQPFSPEERNSVNAKYGIGPQQEADAADAVGSGMPSAVGRSLFDLLAPSGLRGAYDWLRPGAKKRRATENRQRGVLGAP